MHHADRGAGGCCRNVGCEPPRMLLTTDIPKLEVDHMIPKGAAVEAKELRHGLVSQISQLHITGGLRATMGPEGWMLGPLMVEGGTGSLQPLPLHLVRNVVDRLGQRIIGGDNIVLPDDPLPARMWTPIGKTGVVLAAPLMWGSIASAARKAGDNHFARLARHIAFTAQAAGIRLRDASDQYHGQLYQATKESTPVGHRYSNLQAFDLHLAFHSLAAEMGSARDYLAAAFSERLGLSKIDSLSKLAYMKGLKERPDVMDHPILGVMLRASNQSDLDPWLFHLAEYRNKFLHREPLIGSADGAMLELKHCETDSIKVNVVQLNIYDGGDALSIFAEIYERLLILLALAASHAGHSAEPEQVTIAS